MRKAEITYLMQGAASVLMLGTIVIATLALFSGNYPLAGINVILFSINFAIFMLQDRIRQLTKHPKARI